MKKKALNPAVQTAIDAAASTVLGDSTRRTWHSTEDLRERISTISRVTNTCWFECIEYAERAHNVRLDH